MLKVLHSIVKQIEKTGALPYLVPLAPWSTRCNLTVVFGSPLWARADYWRILCLLSRLNRLRWAVNLQSVQMSSLAGLSRGPRQAESARDCLSLPKDSKISNTVYGMAATMPNRLLTTCCYPAVIGREPSLLNFSSYFGFCSPQIKIW